MNVGLKTLKARWQDQSLIPDLNFNFEEIRRAFRKIESNDVDNWLTYTPTLTASGGGLVTTGVAWLARYKRYGTTGDFKIEMTVSANMAAAPGLGVYSWTLPPGWTAVTGTEQLGVGTFLRPGVQRYLAIPIILGGTNTIQVVATDNNGTWGAGGPGRVYAWANGDLVVLEGRLELVPV